jgi:hypothetical protein
MNLETGMTRSIEAEGNQYLKALGFLNDDFLYGIAEGEDIVRDVAGNVTFAMKTLIIEDFSGNVIKEYAPEGIYVTDVSIEPGLAQLTCATKKKKKFIPADTDNIINNRQSGFSDVSVALGSSARQGTTVSLRMPKVVSNLSPAVSVARIKYAQGPSRLEMPAEENFPMYYVYAKGGLMSSLTDPARAVILADDNVGVVLNEKGQYVYERGNKQTKTELANSDIPEAILSGAFDCDELASKVDSQVQIINLSGCTLDQVLYQLSSGRAVVTRLADGSVTVIVGYDRYNTLLYNYDTGEHYYMGINDSTASMLEGGNLFVSYLESRSTVK